MLIGTTSLRRLEEAISSRSVTTLVRSRGSRRDLDDKKKPIQRRGPPTKCKASARTFLLCNENSMHFRNVKTSRSLRPVNVMLIQGAIYRRFVASQRGVAAIEFAIIMPVLLILFSVHLTWAMQLLLT